MRYCLRHLKCSIGAHLGHLDGSRRCFLEHSARKVHRPLYLPHTSGETRRVFLLLSIQCLSCPSRLQYAYRGAAYGYRPLPFDVLGLVRRYADVSASRQSS